MSFLDYIASSIQGMILIVMLYHIANYYFIKDKSFLLYALYLFVIILFTIPYINNNISVWLYNLYPFFFEKSRWFLEIIFIIIYAWFSYYFLDVKNKDLTLEKVTRGYILFFSITTFIAFIINLFLFNHNFIQNYNIYFFVPLNIIIGSFLCYKIYKLKTTLSQYYLLGLIFFSITSLFFLFYTYNPPNSLMVTYGVKPSDIFIFGIFIEIIFISIGLGYKNLIYREEKEKSKLKAIVKLQENQKLKQLKKQELQKKLAQKRQDLLRINKEAEKRKITQAQQQFETQINQLKLSSLLQQMNPHFIFNALNSIKLFIIENDAKKAAYYLTKFSKLIRRILNASTQKQTSLTKELETLELYLNIENSRFSNEINYNVEITKNINTDNIIVPSLILQPFVENAIWHGLSLKKGDKSINIFIDTISKEYYKIDITDNGIGRKEALKNKEKRTFKRKSVGMKITQERLKNFTKSHEKGYNLSFTDLLDNNKASLGTKVTLHLPINLYRDE